MLKDILYYVFVYPLESILNALFLFLNQWTSSYGESIILLSLIVNIFLLRLFLLADRIAQDHASLKSRLDLKILEFKRVFKGAEFYAYLKTLYRQNHYHPIYALKAVGGLALQIPFFVATVFLLELHLAELKGEKFWLISDLSSPDNLIWGINVLPILMTFFTLCNVFIVSKKRGEIFQGAAIACIFLVLLYRMPSALLLYWTTSMLFGLLKNIYLKYAPNLFGKGLVSKITIHFFQKENDTNQCLLYKNISIFAVLNLGVLIFIYNPYTLYASDISQFDFEETWNTLGALFGFFLLFAFLAIYGLSFFYKTKFIRIIAYLSFTVVIITLIYNFALDYNVFTGEGYGHLDKMIFSAKRSVFVEPKKYLILCDLLVGVFSLFLALVFFLACKKSIVKIEQFLLLIFLILSIVSFSKIGLKMLDVSSSPLTISQNYKNESVDSQEFLPDYNERLLGFSKKQNILVLVLDGFTGSHFQDILDMYPKYYEIFDGFVFYDNTLSSSSFTFFTTSSLIGGEKFTLNKLYEKYGRVIDEDTMLYEAHEAFKNTTLNFEKHGWRVDVLNAVPTTFVKSAILNSNTDWMLDKDIAFYYGFPYRDYHFSKMRKVFDFNLEQRRSFVRELALFGLFKISPYSFRAIMYDRGWKFIQDANERLLGDVLDFSSDVLNLGVLSNTSSSKPTFKYIKSMISHAPFGLDSQKGCVPSKNFTSLLPEKYKKFHPIDEDYLYHFDNEICAISGVSDFLAWLKKENIYDQTQIIIVSDHDWADTYRQMENNDGKILGYRSNPLLLVKNFNAKGKMQINHSLRANYNTYDFFMKALEGANYRPKQIDVLFHTEVDFKGNLKRIYEIREDVYHPKHWKDVTQTFINNLNQEEVKR